VNDLNVWLLISNTIAMDNLLQLLDVICKQLMSQTKTTCPSQHNLFTYMVKYMYLIIMV